jgi:hypothetical protein
MRTTEVKGNIRHLCCHTDLRNSLHGYIYNWKDNSKLISLRRLAYRLNMSLYDLLSANEKAIQLPLEIISPNEMPEHLQKRQRVKHNHKKEYQKILDLLERLKSPPA